MRRSSQLEAESALKNRMDWLIEDALMTDVILANAI